MLLHELECYHRLACAGRMDDGCHLLFLQHGFDCSVCIFVVFVKMYAHLLPPGETLH